MSKKALISYAVISEKVKYRSQYMPLKKIGIYIIKF